MYITTYWAAFAAKKIDLLKPDAAPRRDSSYAYQYNTHRIKFEAAKGLLL